jgi:drug/metabolite transporter (DMT)-like permease
MKTTKYTGHIALFVANIFFGLNNPLTRSLMPDIIHPYVITILRIGGGMVLFWLASLFLEREKVPVKDLVKLFFAALFSITINMLAFFSGLSMTSPIDASIVVTLLPIVSMILAAFINKEPITFLKAVGVIVGASGALLLVFSSHGSQIGSGSFVGNLIVLAAVISFALYLTLFRELISKYKAVTVMKWMFLFATIQSYPFCHQELVNADFSAYNTEVLLKIAYIVIIATFVSYLLVAIGQKVLRPTTLSMYNYLQPIVASFVAVFMMMDTFGYDKILSAVLVFAGVYIVTQSKSRAQIEAEKSGLPFGKDVKGN